MRTSWRQWLFRRRKQQTAISKPMVVIATEASIRRLIEDDFDEDPGMCNPDLGTFWATQIINQGPTLADPPIYERETAVLRI